jgi:hypothetical protein
MMVQSYRPAYCARVSAFTTSRDLPAVSSTRETFLPESRGLASQSATSHALAVKYRTSLEVYRIAARSLEVTGVAVFRREKIKHVTCHDTIVYTDATWLDCAGVGDITVYRRICNADAVNCAGVVDRPAGTGNVESAGGSSFWHCSCNEYARQNRGE